MLLPLTAYRPEEFSYETVKKSKQCEPQMDVSGTTGRRTLQTLTWLCPQSKPGAVQAVLHKREKEVEQEKEEGQEKTASVR